MVVSIWQLVIILALVAIVVIPWLMVIFSSKVSGRKKFIWFLFAMSLSWIGYLLYYFAVVRKLSGREPEFIPRPNNTNRQFPY